MNNHFKLMQDMQFIKAIFLFLVPFTVENLHFQVIHMSFICSVIKVFVQFQLQGSLFIWLGST